MINKRKQPLKEYGGKVVSHMQGKKETSPGSEDFQIITLSHEE